ncbi:MAG: ParB/RepB/Spo0J family partition protein [Chloroflexota bacterium]|nr:ParB/RepB/Spo0J family partition protein [Chloroflexota bacterium]
MPTNRPPVTLRPRPAVLAPSGPGPRLAEAWHIPLDRIDLNPHQARQHFDEAALGELTASVRAHGVLEPILVRPVEDTERYEILAGERRYRAAQAAGLDSIPALVRQGVDDTAAQVITALENLQREDLLPGDEARQYHRLLDALGMSRRELAEHLGVDRNRIARLLTILDKGPALLDAVDAGDLSINAALGQLDSGYYTPTNLAQIEPILQAGSSSGANYNGANLAQIEPILQAGSSSAADAPTPGEAIAIDSVAGLRHVLREPEDFPAGSDPPQRVSRHELIGPGQPVDRAYRPTRHFANYVSRLQPTDVPPPQRLGLAEELEAAAHEATLLARALRQAAGQGADQG